MVYCRGEVDALRFSSFTEMFAWWADSARTGPALCWATERGLKTMSYAELRQAVAEESDRLRREEPLGRCTGFFFTETGPDTLIRLFGAVAAGRQIVLLDAETPLPVLKGLLPYTDIDTLAGDTEKAELLAGDLCRPKVTDGAGRILFFTSGTTSRSKAVTLTERSLCASAWNGGALLPLRPGDRLLSLLPLHHVFGFVCSLLWGLSCGAVVQLGRGPRYFYEDCDLFRPTAIAVVPALLNDLLRQKALNDELELILVGAGDCPAALLEEAKAGGRRVCFGYGLTETSSGVALSLGDDPHLMTVCPEVTVRLAEDGEILVEAPGCLMQGYYKSPTDTARVLSDGVLRTGDLGEKDGDGHLRITGRKKEILVLPNGTKLFLPEYEAEIAKALSARELAVTLRDGAPVLLLSGDVRDRARIEAALAPLMAARPRSQRLADIVFLDGPLPRSGTGKPMRWALQQRARQG